VLNEARPARIPVANYNFVVVPILNPSTNSTAFSCPFSTDRTVSISCRYQSNQLHKVMMQLPATQQTQTQAEMYLAIVAALLS